MTSQRWIPACLLLLIAGAAPAREPARNWTGWHAGAFGGYVDAGLTSDSSGHEQTTGQYDDNSPILGIRGGYDRQFANGWLAGAELILPLYMSKGTALDTLYFPDSNPRVKYEADFRWGVLLGGRAGRPFGKALPYVFAAAGLGNANGKTLNVDDNDNYSPGFVQSAAATHFIWQAGGGGEYQLTPRVVAGGRVGAFMGAKADHTMPWNEPGPNKFGMKSLLLQANLGYRF
jgi:opacity protein-like surface antigen